MVRNHEQTYWIAWGEHSEERRRIRVTEQYNAADRTC